MILVRSLRPLPLWAEPFPLFVSLSSVSGRLSAARGRIARPPWFEDGGQGGAGPADSVRVCFGPGARVLIDWSSSRRQGGILTAACLNRSMRTAPVSFGRIV